MDNPVHVCGKNKKINLDSNVKHRRPEKKTRFKKQGSKKALLNKLSADQK